VKEKLQKAIRVTGRGSPMSFETSKFPHFLENLIRDGDDFASLKRQSRSIPLEDSWYSFL
jgi:hypothetical protein